LFIIKKKCHKDIIELIRQFDPLFGN
jgi:hypothetical protein